jgi:hypothetical protein
VTVPLINYSQYIYYPGGDPAGEVLMDVRLTGGNIDVPLFADKAGTSPLTNPVETAADGLLSFYAAPGDYTVWFAGTAWPIPVDPGETDPAWPGKFIHEQSTPALVWTIGHHFGTRPSVDVVSGGAEIQGDVQHPDDETTIITFGVPTGGTAYLRR